MGVDINWGLLNNGKGALDYFNQGRSLVQDVQHAQEERKVKSALATYAQNPDDPAALKELAKHRPELAIQIGERQRKRQQELQQQDLQRRAAGGDTAAAGQLAGIDLDAYLKLDKRTQDQLHERVDFIGQAALAVKQLPPEQRPAAWDQYIDYGVQNGHADLAGQKGKFSEQGLDAAIAQSKLVKDAISLAKPDYQVVPEGGTLVNTKDPAALAAVASGGVGSAPVQVRSIDEAKRLPPGTKFLDPNGVQRIVPGGQTATPSGTFRQSVSGARPVSDGKAVISQLFPGARVTDNRRDPNSALGRANPGSWHNRSGGAVDVAPIKGMTFEQYVSRVKSAGYNIIEARDEVKNPSKHATGPHWHIVIGEG